MMNSGNGPASETPAAPDMWNGTKDPASEDDGIYRIYTSAQLAWIAEETNKGNLDGFSGKTVRLMNDLDFNKVSWIPIGTPEHPFKGTFDGNNKIINNVFKIEGTDYVGLFGYTEGGKISDITVRNVNLSGGEYVAPLAGYLGSEAKNITVDAVDFENKVTGNRFVGGLAGYIAADITNLTVKNTEINGNRVTEDISYSLTHKGDNVGGITGFANAHLDNCSVSDTKITAYRNVGGIVGNIQESNSAISVKSANVSGVTITVDHTGITDETEKDNIFAGKIYGRSTSESTATDPVVTNTNIIKINCGGTDVAEEAAAAEEIDELTPPTEPIGLDTYVLDNVTINGGANPGLRIKAGETVTIIIKGTCTITSDSSDAIQVPATSTLIIKGYDKDSRLIVNGATVSGNGAGIGMASAYTGEISIIDIAELSAVANGTHAFAIGGNHATVHIASTKITQAIGGGLDSTLNTTLGLSKRDVFGIDAQGGCGIGGTYVEISDSQILLAAGGSKASGIGELFHESTSISITDSTIGAAYGGSYCAGVGGTRMDDPPASANQTTTVVIANSDITAYGGKYGAGVGSGYDTHCPVDQGDCVIIITSYSKITARGGLYSADIGTGYHNGRLSGYIDATVDLSGTLDHVRNTTDKKVDAYYKDEYSLAQVIGYGIVDPSRDGLVLYESSTNALTDVHFTVAGVLIDAPVVNAMPSNVALYKIDYEHGVYVYESPGQYTA